MTQKDVFLDRSHISQLAAMILSGKDARIRIDLPPPVIVKVNNKYLFIGTFSVCLQFAMRVNVLSNCI